MKKIILSFALLTTFSSAFASCTDMYDTAYSSNNYILIHKGIGSKALNKTLKKVDECLMNNDRSCNYKGIKKLHEIYVTSLKQAVKKQADYALKNGNISKSDQILETPLNLLDSYELSRVISVANRFEMICRESWKDSYAMSEQGIIDFLISRNWLFWTADEAIQNLKNYLPQFISERKEMDRRKEIAYSETSSTSNSGSTVSAPRGGSSASTSVSSSCPADAHVEAYTYNVAGEVFRSQRVPSCAVATQMILNQCLVSPSGTSDSCNNNMVCKRWCE